MLGKEAALKWIGDLLSEDKPCGWWRSEGGRFLREFEARFAEYVGVAEAVGVSSGTAAIYVALRACEVKRGDSVILSPYTHIGSLAPIIEIGAKPIFVDVDEKGNLDQKAVLAFIEEEKPKNLEAVLCAHQLGSPCEMDELVNRDFAIVEDASQSLGATYLDFKVGAWGDVGCFSIGGDMTKTISTGEGGMITTNDYEIAEKCRKIRNHGEKAGADYSCFNFRMADLNAALGLAQMEHMDRQIDWQIENANAFLRQMDSRRFSSFVGSASRDDICTFIGGRVKWPLDRAELLRYIGNGGWDLGTPRRTIGPGYSSLLYDISIYRRYRRDTPNARRLVETALWIDYHRYPVSRKEVLDLADYLVRFEP